MNGTKIIMKILFFENLSSDLVKSRFPLGQYFEDNGFKSFYACPNEDLEGVTNIKMQRDSLSPISLLRSVNTLSQVEIDKSIDIILSFRLVPNIINYCASFIKRRKRILVITGLGFAFIETNKSVKVWFIQKCIKIFYKMASKRVILIAQNWDDLRDLEITQGNYVINGSGVCGASTKKEVYVKNLRLLYVGRLLKSKGVISAFELFQKILESKPEARLIIAGTIDLSNPDSIDKELLDRIIDSPNIDYLGYVEDIDAIYENCNVLLFPSMYREGIPRVILESLRHGLTILTYNRPGCRETIEGNGLLINPGEFCDNSTLNYILSLNEDLLKVNSVKSRLIFDTKFSSNVIYPEFLETVNDQL